MGRTRYRILNTDRLHFLTCTTVKWIPLFSNPDVARIIIDSLAYLQKSGRLKVYSYVIMKDHVHLIASALNLTKEIGNFKSFTARVIIDMLKKNHSDSLLLQLSENRTRRETDREYQVWQEGSHPEEITSEEMMRQKIEYIHYNPVKRGYVDEPTQWEFSSARNYEEDKGLLNVTTEW